MSEWKRLFDDLAASITAGDLRPGERLPTEHELALSRRISRNTVRRAYLALSQAGQIRIVNGRGSFVMRTGITYEIDAESRFRDVLEREGVKSSIRVIGIGIEQAEAQVAEVLGLRTGGAVLRQTQLILGDDVPFILTSRFFPANLVPDFEARLIESGSFTALLRESGYGALQRSSTVVGARMPESDEAALLKVPLNAALLDVLAVGKLENGQAVEWQHALMNSQLLKLSFRS